MADEILISDIVDLTGIGQDIDKVLAQINRVDKAIQEVNSKRINAGNIGSLKDLKEYVQSLDSAKKNLDGLTTSVYKNNTSLNDSMSVTKQNTKAINDNVSAYQKLKNEVKEAELNAKSLAVQFGVDSKEALEASKAYDVLRIKLELVNNVTKKVAAPQSNIVDRGLSVQGTGQFPQAPLTNIAIQDQSKQIQDTKQAVTDLEKEQAKASNTATTFGNAQLEASENLETEAKVIPELIGELDEFTGSIFQNVRAQLENNSALAVNRAEQKELLASLSTNGRLTDEQTSKFARLKAEELSLVETNRNLTTTIKNQVKEFNTEQGSIDNLRARVNLLQRAYEGLSASEKQSDFGVRLKTQIGQLEPTLKTMESEIGKNQRNVGNYAGAVTGVFQKSFSYLRQLAYIIPGLGMAGIIGLASDAVVGLVEELFHFESAGEKAERQTKELTAVIKEQSEAFGDFKDSVAVAVDKTIAKLKELGATQYEIQNIKLTGLGLNKEKVEQDAKANIASLNTYLNDLKEIKDRYQNANKNIDVTDIGVGAIKKEITDFLKGPLSSIADIQISDADVKNLEKIRNISNQIINLETSKGFKKLTDTEKETFNQIKQLTSAILGNVKEVKTFSDQIEVQLAEQNAERIKAVRDATRERIEGEIETTANINQRNKKALLDAIKYEQDVKAGNFDALRKQVIAERDFELNAENDKIRKINAIRALELAKPENTEADKIRINAKADAEIAAAKLTSKEREKIQKETASKLFDIDEAERLREAKALADYQNAILNDDKAFQNELISNTIGSIETRKKALEGFVRDQIELAKSNLSLQLQQSGFSSAEAQQFIATGEYQIANKKITESELLAIQRQYESQVLGIMRDTEKQQTEIVRQEIEKQDRLRQESIDRIETIYSSRSLNSFSQYADDVIALNKANDEKKISNEKYDRERRRLDQKYRVDSIRTTIDQIEEELTAYDGAEQRFSAADLKLQQDRDKLRQLEKTKNNEALIERLENEIAVDEAVYNSAKDLVDKKIALLNKLKAAQKDQAEANTAGNNDEINENKGKWEFILSGTSNFISGIKSLYDELSDARIQAYEAEKDALENRYQREIDMINQTYVNAVDRDNALAKAKAKNAAAKKQLDDKERVENIKKAKFDKEAAIFSIIINTAAAIVRDLGNPLKIAFDAATGAAQLAVAIAQPLPRYFKGKNVDQFTNDSYEGFAWVNDGGKKEAIIREDGSVELPQKMNTIKWVDKNDIILPDANMLAWQATKSAAGIQPINVITTSNGIGREEYMYGVKNIVAAIKNQPRPRRTNTQDDLMKLWVSSNKSWSEFFK